MKISWSAQMAKEEEKRRLRTVPAKSSLGISLPRAVAKLSIIRAEENRWLPGVISVKMILSSLLQIRKFLRVLQIA
jgi:hypothetical protein